MTTIKTKRAYDDTDATDGFRVLVDRLWPRGLSKESLKLDLWMKDIAPSTELRQWYHKNPDGNWEHFREKYLRELKESDAIDAFANQIKSHKTVTLLYASKDEQHNHARILKEVLKKS